MQLQEICPDVALAKHFKNFVRSNYAEIVRGEPFSKWLSSVYSLNIQMLMKACKIGPLDLIPEEKKEGDTSEQYKQAAFKQTILSIANGIAGEEKYKKDAPMRYQQNQENFEAALRTLLQKNINVYRSGAMKQKLLLEGEIKKVGIAFGFFKAYAMEAAQRLAKEIPCEEFAKDADVLIDVKEDQDLLIRSGLKVQ